jgi:hypothetical protein
MKIYRDAWLLGCLLNDMPMGSFVERIGDTETNWTCCFKDKHEALLEISKFKYRGLWRHLARV